MIKPSQQSESVATRDVCSRVAVTSTDNEWTTVAQRSAHRFGLRYIEFVDEHGMDNIDFLIQCSSAGTAIVDKRSSNGPVSLDYTTGSLRHRQRFGGGTGQTLAKALGLKAKNPPNYVLDATAGYGKDAFVVAGLGCKVLMLERSPVLCCLLEQALNHASRDSEIKDISERMALVHGNSTAFMQSLIDYKPHSDSFADTFADPTEDKTEDKAEDKTENTTKNAADESTGDMVPDEPHRGGIPRFPDSTFIHGIASQRDLGLTSRPDVIYLDPMYPPSGKSAKVKKDMQLLHRLIGPDADNDLLLSTALECARKQVVIKRPKGAEPITARSPVGHAPVGRLPHRVVTSPNTRYDIYLCNTDLTKEKPE